MTWNLKPRAPDFIISKDLAHTPYIRRWWLYRGAPEGFKLYLHNQVRDDEDRALHDHPADNISLILKGGYIEHQPGGVVKHRYPGMIVRRPAALAHRLELHKDPQGNPIPSWSLFIFGPKIREWGFHCPRGWIPWQDFCDDQDAGKVGKGCD